MKNGLLVAAGIVGFGVISGSAMSNNHTFEVVGPLVAVAGLALAALGLRRRGLR
jgi:CHASE2 domain-containing sensor protein